MSLSYKPQEVLNPNTAHRARYSMVRVDSVPRIINAPYRAAFAYATPMEPNLNQSGSVCAARPKRE